MNIRDYGPDDMEPIVALSLRAWEPVFASLEQTLGPELFVRLRGDWRKGQAGDVSAMLDHQANRVWVTEAEGEVAGFVAATRHAETKIGEIPMLAVDPAHQRRGHGIELIRTATDWLRESGMTVAMVETGGDPGHLPARRTYEALGFTTLPVSRYFKAL